MPDRAVYSFSDVSKCLSHIPQEATATKMTAEISKNDPWGNGAERKDYFSWRMVAGT